MDQLHAVLLGLLLACPAGAASASVVWLCGLPGDGTRLVCVADIDPIDASSSPASATTAVVNGTRFPLDAARVYTVELWSPPTDPDFVRLLARATLCYRSPDCQVTVAPGPWLTAR